MWDFDGRGGWGTVWHWILGIFWGVGQLLALLVFLGVLFLFVRFLLVATRAAHLYIARNGPPPAAARTAPTTRPAPSTTARTATTRTTPTGTTPTRRTPKPPAT